MFAETGVSLPRLLTLALGAASVVALLLFASQFRKNRELIKARVFLLFDQIHRMWIAGILVIMAAIAIHVTFSVTVDANFSTWERFLGSGIYAAVGYAGAIVVGLIGFLVLYPVGRRRG